MSCFNERKSNSTFFLGHVRSQFLLLSLNLSLPHATGNDEFVGSIPLFKFAISFLFQSIFIFLLGTSINGVVLFDPTPLSHAFMYKSFCNVLTKKFPFPLGVWRHYIHCSGAAYEWMTSRSKTGECEKRLLPGDLSFSLEKNHLRMTSNFYICFSREPSTSRWSSCRSSPNSDSIALFSLSARQWEIFSSTEQLVYLVGHIFLL